MISAVAWKDLSGVGPSDARPDMSIVEALYDELRGRLTRAIWSQTHDPELAADVVQEAFFLLAREVQGGRMPSNPSGWIGRVAHNLACSNGRRAAVAKRASARLPAPSVDRSSEEVFVAEEQARVLWSVVRDLRPIDQEVLMLAAAGFRGGEIATRINRSHAAARVLLHRARKTVRDRIAALEPGERTGV